MTKQWQLRAVGLVLALAASAASHAQILFGQTAGFSGQVAAGVKETTDGALLYIACHQRQRRCQRPENRADLPGRQVRPQAGRGKRPHAD